MIFDRWDIVAAHYAFCADYDPGRGSHPAHEEEGSNCREIYLAMVENDRRCHECERAKGGGR